MGEWCSLCYANRKRRSNYKGHLGYILPRLLTFEGVEMAIKKRDRAVSASGGAIKLAPGQLEKKLAHLWEFLTATTYEDGSPRTLGTVNIFIDEGCVKGFINDRDANQSACVSSGGILGLLEAMNDGLAADSLQWRAKEPMKKRK
jgi:hypothetical protein